MVTGYETHKNLHNLSESELESLLIERNSTHGAYQTYVVVTRPEATDYGPESAWGAIIKKSELAEGTEKPLISGIHGPFSKKIRLDTFVEQGLKRRADQKSASVPIDIETGAPVHVQKQRKFIEFVLFEYLSQNRPVDWEAIRNYANDYFGAEGIAPLSDAQLQQMVDTSFREFLYVSGLAQHIYKITADAPNLEQAYLITDRLYRELVRPKASMAASRIRRTDA